MRRQRLAGAAGALAAFVVVLVVALGSGGSSKHASHRGGAHPTAARRSGQIVPGGPLAPASVGGLAALLAPQNVVASQPGTAAAY